VRRILSFLIFIVCCLTVMMLRITPYKGINFDFLVLIGWLSFWYAIIGSLRES
jgi:hypothetical protein